MSDPVVTYLAEKTDALQMVPPSFVANNLWRRRWCSFAILTRQWRRTWSVLDRSGWWNSLMLFVINSGFGRGGRRVAWMVDGV